MSTTTEQSLSPHLTQSRSIRRQLNYSDITQYHMTRTLAIIWFPAAPTGFHKPVGAAHVFNKLRHFQMLRVLHSSRIHIEDNMISSTKCWKRQAEMLTLWRPLLPYGYSCYKASCDRPGLAVVCNFWHPGTLTLSHERQSARMSKITNAGLTRSVTGCFIAAVPIRQQWASKG